MLLISGALVLIGPVCVGALVGFGKLLAACIAFNLAIVAFIRIGLRKGTIVSQKQWCSRADDERGFRRAFRGAVVLVFLAQAIMAVGALVEAARLS